jgi:predicted ATPase
MRFSVVVTLTTFLVSLAGAVSSTDEYQDAVCRLMKCSLTEAQNSFVLGYRTVGLHGQPQY